VNGLHFVVLVLLSIFLITSGFVDLDWQLVSYRYSEWHRSVEYWEYNPFFKINWYVAYAFNVVRLIVGCVVLGFVLARLSKIEG